MDIHLKDRKFKASSPTSYKCGDTVCHGGLSLIEISQKLLRC